MSGEDDYLTRHAGCPVLVGSKWGKRELVLVNPVNHYSPPSLTHTQSVISGSTREVRSSKDLVKSNLVNIAPERDPEQSHK